MNSSPLNEAIRDVLADFSKADRAASNREVAEEVKLREPERVAEEGAVLVLQELITRVRKLRKNGPKKRGRSATQLMLPDMAKHLLPRLPAEIPRWPEKLAPITLPRGGQADRHRCRVSVTAPGDGLGLCHTGLLTRGPLTVLDGAAQATSADLRDALESLERGGKRVPGRRETCGSMRLTMRARELGGRVVQQPRAGLQARRRSPGAQDVDSDVEPAS
jgi:hypothetical protein